MTPTPQIPVLELRSLLSRLKDNRPDIGVRFRLMGEMWQTNHYHVFQLTERGVVLHEEPSRKIMIVPDLSSIMQFELDQAFQQYAPHFHYSVDAALVNF